ncbi:MAG: DMT family transporter, partial [bacterium]|nr:DMT family transporter [bacterium]
IRAVGATIILYSLLRLRGRRAPSTRAQWSTGLVQGIFQLSVPFVLFTLAYENASAGFVGLFTALIPIGTAIVAHFLLPDEPLHAAKVAGLSLAFAGVAFLLLSGDSGLDEGGKPLVAAMLAVAAVASVSFAGVYAKRHVDNFDPMELTFMQFAIGIFVIGAVMLVFEGIPGTISPWGWMLIAYMTVIGSVVPFIMFFWLLQQVSTTKASLIGYIVPLIALFAGIILLDEKLQLGIGVGGLLILAGVILTDRSERRRILTTPVP